MMAPAIDQDQEAEFFTNSYMLDYVKRTPDGPRAAEFRSELKQREAQWPGIAKREPGWAQADAAINVGLLYRLMDYLEFTEALCEREKCPEHEEGKKLMREVAEVFNSAEPF